MLKLVFHLLLIYTLISSGDSKLIARKLLLPAPVNQNFYIDQLQNTHSLMNDIKNQDRRQNFIRNVADQFNVLSSRLDSFRSELFKKVNLLHMSLERPKIPMTSPGPIRIAPIVDPLVTKNQFSSNVANNFFPQKMTDMLEAKGVQSPFETNLDAMNSQSSLPSMGPESGSGVRMVKSRK